ncbi:spindle and kinetochore-associated protein 2-like isoform X2 [Lineus longissimus]|uniref:spindle and kinetochore-associated protein 2-like isoform X1 n=1 Tax=Lineus longissimus TaxID=88925 RepID=UPI002B4F2965
MEATVDKLELMFQKAESDLDGIGRKLDVEFSNDLDEDLDQMNPAQMLERLRDVKKEYSEVIKEAEEIKNLQKNAAEFFREHLMQACEAVANIQLQTGENPEESEEYDQVAEQLGLPKSDPVGAECGDDVADTEGDGTDSSHGDDAEAKFEGAEDDRPKEKKASTSSAESARDKRKEACDFIDITEEEFMSVSDHTRGRVKLEDVNRTYRILWMHFKDNGNIDAVGPSEMFKMGLKVTGTTGEAKLKVLKALKLLQISTKGYVKLS